MDDRSTSAAIDGRDAPGVLLPPPLIPVAMLAVGVALQRVAPLHVLSQVPLSVRVGAGAAAALAGVCTTVLGVRALARGGTNVSPYMPSLAMVTSGVYARTRNPIYVYARLAGIAATAAALPCGIEQNKSEQRHVLAQVICTFKQGRIADRGHEAQQFRASGLNLVIAAIVYWNSTYLADAVAHMRAEGNPVPAEFLAHTSPLTWEHIGFSGDFLWQSAAATAGLRRPLNLTRNRAAA